MKKEYSIVFESTSRDLINLHPYISKRFPTEAAAEQAIKHLLIGGATSDKIYYIIPCYSKA